MKEMDEKKENEAAGLFARVRASAWGSLLARVVAIAVALGVLAWIGRATTAGAASTSVSDAGASQADASPVAPVAAIATAVPSSTAPPASASSPARGRASPEDPVFLNQADEAELRRLPGVGPKRAEAIVSLRRRVGRFNRIEDLMRVKGIGRAAIKKWRPLVRLDAPPAPDSGAP